MPGKTDNLNILNSGHHDDDDNNISSSNHFNNNINNMNPVDNGGNGVYTIHAMGGAGTNPDRYLSNESLETNSSGGESGSNLGNIPHRKDHEFIPTRMKQIAASKPAADPKQFTRVPSNPLLVSAQKQLMMVEEVKKAKELVTMQPKVKGGDDEPDWQNNLSTWKNRRRKQSEEALQRVSEVKALEDDEFGTTKKSSIGRKLSALLYTAPEDDWSDLGLEKTPHHSRSESGDSPPPKYNSNSRPHSRASLISPTNQGSIREEDNEGEEEGDNNAYNLDRAPPPPPPPSAAFAPPPPPAATTTTAPTKTEKIFVESKTEKSAAVDSPKKETNDTVRQNNISTEKCSSLVETPPTVGVSVLNRKFSEVALTSASGTKPIVTYTNPDQSIPPVRRKSSELSTTMRSRLEAFISPPPPPASSGPETRATGDHTPEPDEKFHEKLSTFRKISEGTKEEEVVQRKPKLSYSSLIAADFTQSNHRTLQDPDEEEDNDESVDQLLDDALEESYRSVLEESSSEANKNNSSLNSEDGKNVIFKGDDFLPAAVVMKAPPTEKPPPPPAPETPKEKKEAPVWHQKVLKPTTILDDEEIDKQEQEIIASLENEEREHKKYMEKTILATRTAPFIEERPFAKSSESIPAAKKISEMPLKKISSNEIPRDKIISSTSSLVTSSSKMTTNEVSTNKMSSSVSQPHLISNKTTTTSTQSVAKKRTSDVGNQKIYNNQHWLIQEAEQRRLAELQQPKGVMKQTTISPASSSPASSMHSQASPSPVYENLNNKQTVKATNFNNHQRPEVAISPAHSDASWQSQPPRSSNAYPQENLYANLGSVPPPQPPYETSPLHFQRDSVNSQSRLPGPQVPPRVQPGDRQTAQNGAKGAGAGSERMLSVSGKKKCSHCKEELGRGAAMIIESLRLFYHLRCFQCCVCHVQLGNGTAGTDVRVRNNKLHCQNCYSNDEGLKFSKV